MEEARGRISNHLRASYEFKSSNYLDPCTPGKIEVIGSHLERPATPRATMIFVRLQADARLIGKSCGHPISSRVHCIQHNIASDLPHFYCLILSCWAARSTLVDFQSGRHSWSTTELQHKLSECPRRAKSATCEFDCAPTRKLTTFFLPTFTLTWPRPLLSRQEGKPSNFSPLSSPGFACHKRHAHKLGDSPCLWLAS